MAYIAPNTDIYFLEKILLKPNYEHTYYFANIQDQQSFFNSKIKYIKGTQSYQRVSAGSLRVEMTVEEAYQVNYIMFKNTSFENKWFYAFILGDPIYINNNTVEFNYQIDIMQTWMFDYEIKPCYIQRNHTSTDVVGENIEDEGLSTGYIETVGEYKTLSGVQLGCIVTSKPLPDVCYGKPHILQGSQIMVRMNLGSHCLPLYSLADSYRIAIRQTNQAGQASTLYYYYNIPLSKQDFDSIQYKSNYNLFQPQYAWKMIDAAQQFYNGTNDYNVPITIEEILYAINLPYIEDNFESIKQMFQSIDYGERCYYYDCGGSVPTGIYSIPIIGTTRTSLFTPNDIFAIYQYPIEFAFKHWQNNAVNEYNNSNGFSISNEETIASPYRFDAYIPNNKKLYTYPYNYIEATDNEGNTKEYKYELSNNDYKPNGVPAITYKIFGQFGLTPTATFVPTNYLHEAENFCHSFTNKNYVQCAYTANQYNVWRQQNAQEMLGRAINAGTQLALTAAGVPNINLLGATQRNSEHGKTEYKADTHQYIDANSRNEGGREGDYDAYTRYDKNGKPSTQEVFHSYDHAAYVNTYTKPNTWNKSESNTRQERRENSTYNRMGWDSIGSAEKLYGITSLMAARSDAQTLTNNVSAPTHNIMLNNAIKLKTISVKMKQITPAYAERIDKYFDMFGYKINKVGIPNRFVRKYWTYVKTTNCTISLVNSIPTSDVQEICACYNSGITFWTRAENSDIGDYNRKNELVAGEPDRPISIIKFYKSDNTQIPFVFNPLVYHNNISFSDATNSIKIQVYGYCDVKYEGSVVPEVIDQDLTNKMFVINGLHTGDNYITIEGTQTYNFVVNYTPVNVIGVSIYRSYNPLANPIELIPEFNPRNFTYAAQISTNDPTDNLIYFYCNEAPYNITANGNITFMDANTARIELLEGSNNITLTANTVTYTFSIQFIASSQTISGVYSDINLTTPIPMTPASFYPTTYEYSIQASAIPQNNTIYIKFIYPVNNLTVNGTYIYADGNGVFTISLLRGMNNFVRWTQNGYNNAQLQIDLR